jgi:hypothetical protein
VVAGQLITGSLAASRRSANRAVAPATAACPHLTDAVAKVSGIWLAQQSNHRSRLLNRSCAFDPDPQKSFLGSIDPIRKIRGLALAYPSDVAFSPRGDGLAITSWQVGWVLSVGARATATLAQKSGRLGSG